MDVWDNLLIRACKANHFKINILRRILARRCDMSPTFIENAFIAEKLLNLATQLKKERTAYWYLFESSAERAFWYGGDEKTEYWERVINVAASVLRFTSIDELPTTFRSGLRWKNPKILLDKSGKDRDGTGNEAIEDTTLIDFEVTDSR